MAETAATLVERLRDPHYLDDDSKARLPEPAADLIYLLRAERREAADALEAQRARVSELERELAQMFSQVSRKPDWIARAEAAEARVSELTEAPTETEIESAIFAVKLGLEAGVAWPVNVGAALRRFVEARKALTEHPNG